MKILCQLQFATEAYVVLLALEKTSMQSTEESPPNLGDSEDERGGVPVAVKNSSAGMFSLPEDNQLFGTNDAFIFDRVGHSLNPIMDCCLLWTKTLS